MIFDCHFRHAIVINRLSIQINRHLSTPIDCPRHPAIRLFPQSIAQRRPAIRLFPQSIAQRRPTIRLFSQSIANVIRPFDYFLNRLPTSSDHSIISSIDCPGFTPWAGVCRTFGAGWGWCLFLLAVFFNNLFFLLPPIHIQSFGFQIIFM